MVNRRSPSFFKILLDTSAPHLPLPPDFASKYFEDKIPKYPIIRSVIGGYSWRLKIKKIGESCCFSDGWSSVVEDIQLGFGDFLVFRYVDESIFDLVVFSPNGCEKEFPPKIDVDSGTVDDVVVVKDVDDVEEDEDEVEDEDDVIVKHVNDVEEDEDEDEDEEDDEEEYEDENDDGDDDDEDDDDDGGGDIDGNDGDPFFMIIISKSHKTMMRLPPDFVELAGIDGEGTLTLKNLDGKEWQTGLRKEKLNQTERYYLSAGWTDFRRSNDISDGDECCFKFIRGEDKLLLARVFKKKRPARQPERNSGETAATEVVEGKVTPKQNSGETPATEVVERKVKPKRNSGETPATEVVEKRRVRSERNSGETPATKVVERRVQPKRNSGIDPATKHGGGVRKRGRPAKRRRTR